MVDIGDGYRRLGPEDIIRDGDEFTSEILSPTWSESMRDGTPVCDMADSYVYRRKIEPNKNQCVAMPDNSKPITALPAFTVGLLIGLMVMLTSWVWMGFGPTGHPWWIDAVKSGVGEYDSQNGKFKWKTVEEKKATD